MLKTWKRGILVSLVAAGLCACPEPAPTTPPEEVPTSLSGQVTWKAGTTYLLKGHTFLVNGSLTVEAGVKVVGEPGSSLVITQTGRLEAVGTVDKPIVFTSAKAEGQRAPGDWGGVVLLGRAGLNLPPQYVEGFVAGIDENTKYGGTEDSHSCGRLRYVRIEFAGFKLRNDSELNGLTVAGCGSGTELDYIQVHRGADDGIEFFGGTANLKHAVVTLADDDGLDWDQGYRGRVQFLIVQQGEGVGNSGIEADNTDKGVDLTPRSSPQVWNATLIGRASGGSARPMGMLLRAGTAGQINNAIVAHFGDQGIDIDGAAAAAQFRSGALSVKYTLFWDIRGSNSSLPGESDNDGGLVEATELLAPTTSNRFLDPGLTAARDTRAPSFKPTAGANALNPSYSDSPPGGFFDASARFVGAVGTEDWTAGWTAYPAN